MSKSPIGNVSFESTVYCVSVEVEERLELLEENLGELFYNSSF